MSRRDALQVLALCQLAKRNIEKVEKEARIVADVSYPDEKSSAVIDDVVVANTSRVSRKPELLVDDQDMFVAWVGEHYPTELVQAVRPSFLTVLLDNARIAGAVLGPGGEVCESAGLADPVFYTTTRLTKDADRLLGPLLEGKTLADLPAFIRDGA